MHDQPVAFITGAADGIGWATAQAFAAAGYAVVLADLDEVRATEQARALGDAHFGVRCDVSLEAEVRAALTRTHERHGRLDAVVNNAGIGSPHIPTLEQELGDFQRVLRVHLDGTFLVSREAARVMLAGSGGAIVNVSSIAGLGGLPRRNAYGAAKAGIASMTRSMACEWAGGGIRVNAVAPGYVGTTLVQRLQRDGSIDAKRLESRIPLGRLGLPNEIAQVILFLCSPAASYVTGSIIPVDGGWTAFGDAGPAHAPD